jgi:hypothetical protein
LKKKILLAGSKMSRVVMWVAKGNKKVCTMTFFNKPFTFKGNTCKVFVLPLHCLQSNESCTFTHDIQRYVLHNSSIVWPHLHKETVEHSCLVDQIPKHKQDWHISDSASTQVSTALARSQSHCKEIKRRPECLTSISLPQLNCATVFKCES